MSVALEWFKSSYSTEQGGDCLEVAYDWHKSTYSGDEGGECVEVATHPTAVHVRDSKNPDGPVLTLDPATWTAFTVTFLD
ncbi:DUF397 domain-containing protein [Streptomyces lunaelactis]|uniref:DUF397 domain-containing protein n=1 Tax=Streptomyces lunaelactis TaxID=1535768 RepID=UPI0015855159|nr:DUF397 domain-containing protein [Streptomyces lunaelactis]NUK60242.1 DUF397 domain-containing protein [Streptomyces lunaelactis]NUK74376.1 DUF397 domain-containing protein [Streptomyces lunaelactis]NUK76962.1 DUF397 domain-containing protein [Streptomyces lunaelactis]